MVVDDLLLIGFMKSSNTLMLDCVKNVNNLFISKTCQIYLATARKIFDEDLHDMVRVSDSHFTLVCMDQYFLTTTTELFILFIIV